MRHSHIRRLGLREGIGMCVKQRERALIRVARIPSRKPGYRTKRHGKTVIGRLKSKLIWISDPSTRYKSDEGTFTSMPNTPTKGFKVPAPAGGKVVRDSDLKCRYTFKGSCRASPRLGRVQLQV